MTRRTMLICTVMGRSRRRNDNNKKNEEEEEEVLKTTKMNIQN